MANPWEQIKQLNQYNPDAFPLDNGDYSSWKNLVPPPEEQQAPVAGASLPGTRPAPQPIRKPTGILRESPSAPFKKEDLLNEMLLAQKGGIQGNEELLKAYLQQSPQLDLSPLAALSDSISKGGKLSAGYKAPATLDERAKMIAGLEDMAQGGRQKLAGLLQEGQHSKDDLKRREMELRMMRFGKVYSTPSDKQAENINEFDNAIGEAENLLAGYKPGYTGTLESFKSLPGIKNVMDPESVTYQSQIGRLSDSYRRIVTGAAAADRELQRIESRLPQTNDNEENFKSKGANYIQAMKRAKERYLKTLERKGKDVSEYTNPDDVATGGPSGQGNKINDKEAALLDWANKNPNDPRAVKVKQKLGR